MAKVIYKVDAVKAMKNARMSINYKGQAFE